LNVQSWGRREALEVFFWKGRLGDRGTERRREGGRDVGCGVGWRRKDSVCIVVEWSSWIAGSQGSCRANFEVKGIYGERIAAKCQPWWEKRRGAWTQVFFWGQENGTSLVLRRTAEMVFGAGARRRDWPRMNAEDADWNRGREEGSEVSEGSQKDEAGDDPRSGCPG
jgi:hypothetical protein